MEKDTGLPPLVGRTEGKAKVIGFASSPPRKISRLLPQLLAVEGAWRPPTMGPKGPRKSPGVPRVARQERATSPKGMAEWRLEVEPTPSHVGRNYLPKLPEGNKGPH